MKIYPCDCHTHALSVDVIDDVVYFSIFEQAGKISVWDSITGKCSNLWSVVCGKEKAIQLVCLSQDNTKLILKQIVDATGIKPEKMNQGTEHGRPLAVYVEDAERDKQLYIEPDSHNMIDFHIIKWDAQCLGTKYKWNRIKKTFKSGYFTEFDIAISCKDEIGLLVNYLNHITTRKWN